MPAQAAIASVIAWQDARVHDQAFPLQDIDAAVRTYHYLSERWFTHASPTLFNAGTPRPQLSSCFLIAMKARAWTLFPWHVGQKAADPNPSLLIASVP